MLHCGSAMPMMRLKATLALPREQGLGRLVLADLEIKNGCVLAVPQLFLCFTDHLICIVHSRTQNIGSQHAWCGSVSTWPRSVGSER